MPAYRIAGIPVWLEARYAPLFPQSEPYRIDLPQTECTTILMTDESFSKAREIYPGLDNALLEYMLTGDAFYRLLLKFSGMMLHASAVELDGKAYLFSAPSGTGKSTHASLWLKMFPERAMILNDDKPALRFEDGCVYAYGTPWSGKTSLNLNHKVPLAGICVLERSEVNRIESLKPEDAISPVLEQTVRSRDPEQMTLLLDVISAILQRTPVYKLKCNMNREAAELSYKTMSEGLRQ